MELEDLGPPTFAAHIVRYRGQLLELMGARDRCGAAAVFWLGARAWGGGGAGRGGPRRSCVRVRLTTGGSSSSASRAPRTASGTSVGEEGVDRLRIPWWAALTRTSSLWPSARARPKVGGSHPTRCVRAVVLANMGARRSVASGSLEQVSHVWVEDGVRGL